MKPERVVVPLAAIVLAVFGTSRLIEAIDPGADSAQGEPRTSAIKPKAESGKGRRTKEGKKRKRSSRSSFLSPAGMRRLAALLASEAGSGGRITLFRVQANAAQVQVARSGGGGRLLVIEPGPRIRFSASTPVAVPGGFRPRELDPYAPSRIGAGIARLSGASLRDVDYMVFSIGLVSREGGWDAFLTGAAHTHFHADAHGRDVTRP